jgi:hypothetical protein
VLAARHRDLGARGSYDLAPYQRLQDHQEAAGVMIQDTASALFGVEGLQVIDAQSGPDGALEVWAVTDRPAARACPDCLGACGMPVYQVACCLLRSC